MANTASYTYRSDKGSGVVKATHAYDAVRQLQSAGHAVTHLTLPSGKVWTIPINRTTGQPATIDHTPYNLVPEPKKPDVPFEVLHKYMYHSVHGGKPDQGFVHAASPMEAYQQLRGQGHRVHSLAGEDGRTFRTVKPTFVNPAASPTPSNAGDQTTDHVPEPPPPAGGKITARLGDVTGDAGKERLELFKKKNYPLYLRLRNEPTRTKQLSDGRTAHVLKLLNGRYLVGIKGPDGNLTHARMFHMPESAGRTGRAVPLARKTPEPQGNYAKAAASLNSANHQKRRHIALSILKEAGMVPATVKAVLAHEGGGHVRDSVIQLITQHADPAMARFVAAWYGLLSGEKSLTVFHPNESGEDTLHVITSPHPPEQVSSYLTRSGLPSFSVEPRTVGSRAYVYNPKGTLDVEPLVRGLDASHSRFRGDGNRLGAGGGTATDARAAYRTVISDFENAAGLDRKQSAESAAVKSPSPQTVAPAAPMNPS